MILLASRRGRRWQHGRPCPPLGGQRGTHCGERTASLQPAGNQPIPNYCRILAVARNIFSLVTRSNDLFCGNKSPPNALQWPAWSPATHVHAASSSAVAPAQPGSTWGPRAAPRFTHTSSRSGFHFVMCALSS